MAVDLIHGSRQKTKITFKVEALLEQMSESLWKRYGNIKSRKRDELLKILEEVKSLFNSDNGDNL